MVHKWKENEINSKKTRRVIQIQQLIIEIQKMIISNECVTKHWELCIKSGQLAIDVPNKILLFYHVQVLIKLIRETSRVPQLTYETVKTFITLNSSICIIALKQLAMFVIVHQDGNHLWLLTHFSFTSSFAVEYLKNQVGLCRSRVPSTHQKVCV